LVEILESIFEKKKVDRTFKYYFGTKRAALHPNRISALGALSTSVGTVLLSNPYSAPIGVSGIILGDVVADIYDGKFARDYHLKTKEGAKLDPLFDKVKNIAFGSYVTLNEGIENPLSLLFQGSILTDFISQKQRGPILEQIIEASNAVRSPKRCTPDFEIKSNLRANNYGKYKTTIQAITHITYAVKETIPESILTNNIDNMINDGLALGLGASIILGSIGIYKRIK